MLTDEKPESPPNEPQRRPLRVAIAGASGFVGLALRQRLARDFDLVALTRRLSNPSSVTIDADGVEWRQCDLFDPDSIATAIDGVDLVIYLVHSMSPQSRLTQARFDDLDLVLADNMRRAMNAAGTSHIVFLGGLGAHQDPAMLSRHLISRQEVGIVLGDGDAELTELRAGLVIGHRGSSFRMLIRLIRRLPVMVLPRWTSTPTQPISINDVVRAFSLVLEDPSAWEGQFDLGIEEEMTYGDMIRRAARGLGRNPITVPVPISSPRVSTLWIMLFSGEPASLVIPLIASLKTPTMARANPLLERLDRSSLIGFDQSVKECLAAEGAEEDPRRATRKRDRKVIHQRSLVRSIQRMPMPDDLSPKMALRAYWEWLRGVFRPLLRIRTDISEKNGAVDRVVVHLFGLIPMLELHRQPEGCDDEIESMKIIGGLLVRKQSPPNSRLEFRSIEKCGVLLTALQDYAPSLPWPLYLCSQAWLHLMVMKGFRRWLRRRQ